MSFPFQNPLLVRQLTPNDLDAAERILNEAFKTPGNRRRDLERGLRLQPHGWWLGLLDNEPVGMVGAVEYDSFAWVGLMGVSPDHQSKGIGRQLMTHLLTDLDSRKIPMVLLDASESGRPLYQSQGFVDEDLVYLYERPTSEDSRARASLDSDAGANASPEPLFIRTATLEYLPAMIALDRHIFGASRTGVFREYFSSFPGRCFLAFNASGNLRGLTWAQQRRIGPLVATEISAAELLLERALSLTFEAPPQIIVPGANSAALDLCSKYGFEVKHANRHMRRGGAGLLGNRHHIFGQGSFGIG